MKRRAPVVFRALLGAVLGASACGAPAPPAPPRARPRPADGAPVVASHARWVLLDSTGVVFDEAGELSEVPRPEPAVVGGMRVMLAAGVVVGAARRPEGLRGFRTVPARLGGGFVVWSDARTYHARSFLGPLEPLSDVAAEGGARPYLSSVLLRTAAGLFTIDPREPHRVATRAPLPGIADALAVDERRAVKLDHASRASYTTDGGASWTDVLATRGVLVRGLAAGPAGEVLLDAGPSLTLVLGKAGPLATRDPVAEPRADATAVFGRLPSSRALPSDRLAHAIVGGIVVPGGRVLVAREGGVALLASETGLPLADTDLPGIDARFARCEAAMAGGPALACVGDTGAVLVRVDGSLTHLALEGTFPDVGAGFIGGPRGRLAFDGRCGGDPPASADLAFADDAGARGGDELPPADDARACVRGTSGRWTERRLQGEDAQHLYRWIPGEDADLVALVLSAAPPPGDAGAETASRASDGVRVVRVDPESAALAGGTFPAWAPQLEVPRATIDTDFWLEPDGTVRGWILLPDAEEAEPAHPVAPSAQGPGHRLLPLLARRGGRAAGVRIDAAGHVAVLPLPDGVSEVVRGGAFGLAMAKAEGAATRWFETVDGGATWTAAEPPLIGEIEAPSDATTPFACSQLGCTWGGGVARLGWGSAAPPDEPSEQEPGPSPSAPRRVTIQCSLADAPPWARAARAVPRDALLALALPRVNVPASPRGGFGALALPPFDPAAAARHVALGEHTRHARAARLRAPPEPEEQPEQKGGELVPFLRAKAGPADRPRVDALLLVDDRVVRVGDPGRSAQVPSKGRLVAAVETADGALVALDAEHGVAWLVKGELAAPVVRVSRPLDVTRTRLTLARRADGRLALAAYSTSAGELLVGDLDLGRADIGPLSALGRLDALGAPASCPRPTHHLVVELPIHLVLRSPGAEPAIEDDTTAAALVAAGPDRACVDAAEIVVHRGSGAPTVLRASLRSGAASVTDGATTARGRCSLVEGPREPAP